MSKFPVFRGVVALLALLMANAGCIQNKQCTSAADCFVGEFCQAGVCMERDDTDDADADAPDADGSDADAPDTEHPDTDAPDANVPDAEEPDAEEPDEDVIYEGSLILENAADVQAALPYTEITGGLTFQVNTDNVSSIELPALRRVRGMVMINSLSTTESISMPALTSIGQGFMGSGNAALRSINLPVLESIGGGMTISNTEASSLYFPELRQVGGAVFFSNNTTITSVSLPLLETVNGDFSLINLSMLNDLTLGSLRTVGGTLMLGALQVDRVVLGSLEQIGQSVSIYGNERLEILSMPRLQEQGAQESGNPNLTFSISTTPLLDTLELNALEQVHGIFSMTGVTAELVLEAESLQAVGHNLALTQNSGMHAVVLPALVSVGNNLSVGLNDALISLDLSELENVEGKVTISSNSRLPYCQVAAVQEQLITHGWEGEFSSSGNLADSCS